MVQITPAIQYRLLKKYFISPTTYVLRFTRNNLCFKAGQTLSVGLWGQTHRREYSIYSGENDDFLEILVKVVEHGKVSKALMKVSPGEPLDVHGPGGFFVPSKQDISSKQFLFVATGTGISPFRSIIRSNPSIQYQLLHGIRKLDEAYGSEYIPKERYITCVSQEDTGIFHGRVTTYLSNTYILDDTICYLCGNSTMIYDVYDILKDKGVPTSQIVTEVYF